MEQAAFGNEGRLILFFDDKNLATRASGKSRRVIAKETDAATLAIMAILAIDGIIVTMRMEWQPVLRMRNPLSKSALATLLFCLALVSAGHAQAGRQSPLHPPATPTPTQPSAPSQTPASPQASPSAQPQGTPSPNRVEIEPIQKEHKITPEEGRELFRSVDEILHFASQDTGLPIRKTVKRTIVSRAQVEKYVNDKFKNDADRIRFERSELVQKKFGLLPRDFNLHAFLIKLLIEQVAGYYDEKTKTMNLLEWNEPEMQRPVMAHELTHALQDQSYDLEKMSKRDEEIEKKGLEDLEALIRNDEESTSRSAVLEGQAMIVLLDYVLAPTGGSVAKAPQVVELMQASMDKSRGNPVFDSAPLLLQEELAFPYRQGMQFIKQLLLAGGKELAYKGVLDRLPQTTREVMEPKEYLAGHRVPPLLLPDLGFLKPAYEPFDAGAVGELDVNILLRVYSDEDTASRLTPEWRGGAYYAAGKKGAKPLDRNSTAHVGLLYVSRWATEEAAEDFAKIYAAGLSQRYQSLRRVAAEPAIPGCNQYESSDGPILIQQTGHMVVAVESFDQDLAKKVMEAGMKQAIP
jgi:hypothetical protein